MRATPTARILLAGRQRKWTSVGAFCELIDNAFDPDSGNADAVTITWNKRTRLFTITDDGQGVEDLGWLFTLGEGAEHADTSVGYFGVGGSEALLWLADSVTVHTIRDGKTQTVYPVVNWRRCIESVVFPDVNVRTLKTTAKNTPPELLLAGRGTTITFQAVAERRVIEQPIIDQLAKVYAAGLRAGKSITWNGQAVTAWEPDGVTVTEEYDVDVRGMSARVVVQHAEGLPTRANTLSVNFGYRRLFDTREPFGEYRGAGVTGRVDLSPAFKPFLATTKDDLADDEVRGELLAAVHDAIEPLLERLEREHVQEMLANVAVSLQTKLGGRFKIEVEGEGEGGQKHDGDKELDKPSPGPLDIPTPTREEDAGTVIRLTTAYDDTMAGKFIETRITAGAPIFVTLNLGPKSFKEDDPVAARNPVRSALQRQPINDLLLGMLIAQDIATTVANDDVLLRRMKLFSPRDLQSLLIREDINGDRTRLVPFLVYQLFNAVQVDTTETADLKEVTS